MNSFKVVTSNDDRSFNISDLTPDKSEYALPFSNALEGENDQISDFMHAIGKKQEHLGLDSHMQEHFHKFLYAIAGTAEAAGNFATSLVRYIKSPKEKAVQSYANMLNAFHEKHFVHHELHDALHAKCDDEHCDYQFAPDDCHFCTHGCPYCDAMDQISSDPYKTSSLVHSILASVSEDENYSKIASHPLVVTYLHMKSKVYDEVAKLATSPDSMKRLKSFDTTKTRQSAKLYTAKLDASVTRLSGLDVELSLKLSSFISANLDDNDVLNNFNKWAMSNIPDVMKEAHKVLHECRTTVGVEVNCLYC